MLLKNTTTKKGTDAPPAGRAQALSLWLGELPRITGATTRSPATQDDKTRGLRTTNPKPVAAPPCRDILESAALYSGLPLPRSRLDSSRILIYPHVSALRMLRLTPGGTGDSPGKLVQTVVRPKVHSPALLPASRAVPQPAAASHTTCTLPPRGLPGLSLHT